MWAWPHVAVAYVVMACVVMAFAIMAWDCPTRSMRKHITTMLSQLLCYNNYYVTITIMLSDEIDEEPYNHYVITITVL